MKFLLFLADAFISTFGITQPSAEGRETAAKIIAGLIGIAILSMAIVAVVAIVLARH